MADNSTTSFQLPTGKTIHVHLVQLTSGRIVARTSDELERVPPTLSPSMIADPRR